MRQIHIDTIFLKVYKRLYYADHFVAVKKLGIQFSIQDHYYVLHLPEKGCLVFNSAAHFIQFHNNFLLLKLAFINKYGNAEDQKDVTQLNYNIFKLNNHINLVEWKM